MFAAQVLYNHEANEQTLWHDNTYHDQKNNLYIRNHDAIYLNQ